MKIRGAWLSFAASVALAGCMGKTEATSSTSGSGPGSGSSTGAITETTGGSSLGSSGAASSASSGGNGTSSGGSSGSTSAGTTTGHIPVFVDGGYVFCAAELDIDGGEVTTSWMCQPGTYFCGAPSSCVQCRSDNDCADQDLPTFDSNRSHCDLDSGVAGYWGHCQQCLGNGDCAGNGMDDRCDLNPSSAEPSIETQGFETCANLGPGCPYGTAPGIGGCVPMTCQTDADCAGAIVGSARYESFPQEAAAYCIGGACQPFPPRLPIYFCPNCFCSQDVTCDDGISVCDESSDHCGCTSSAQCGGPWPICELSDAGFTDDAGDRVGFCGCETDPDCGDAGLKCMDLEPNDSSNLYGGKTCLFPCTDPRFPGCADLSPATPICDATSGLCIACETDAQCRKQASGSFVGPFCRFDGECGCQVASDCPDHEVCGGTGGRSSAGGTIYECIAPPLACTPATCSGGACDWDSGVCAATGSGRPVCFNDFDCRAGELCDSDGGCLQCQDDSDCVRSGWAAKGYSTCFSGQCLAACASDSDCTGNPYGSHCLTQRGTCVCGDDADCASAFGGHTCDTNPSDYSFGSCICKASTECLANGSGGACLAVSGQDFSSCTTCGLDSDCASGFFCAPNHACARRCDDGGAGCQAPFSMCDTSNVQGGNANGAVWCYGCLSASDCAAGQACTGSCGSYCYDSSQCHAGEVCGGEYDYACHASCDAGPCPTGKVCDLKGTVIPIPDLCYECLSPGDCENGAGCNSITHTCGTCTGPTVNGGPFECPPDAICSNYWTGGYQTVGVCLQNCDHLPCQDPSKTCEVFPDLTPFHQYCFGCLQDLDCADAGTGAWCDTFVDRTFTCKPQGY